jgi:hypothetical protein
MNSILYVGSICALPLKRISYAVCVTTVRQAIASIVIMYKAPKSVVDYSKLL